MAASSSNTDQHAFNEYYADSDSDDDIPLAELVPLANFDQGNADGSLQVQDQDVEPDQEVDGNDNNHDNNDVNNVEEEEEETPPNVDLNSAFEHEWLGDFVKEHGHKLGEGAEGKSEVEILQSLLTQNVIEFFVVETNRYAEQFFVAHPKETLPPHSLARKWVPVDMGEMAAFVGILYFMGYIKLPTYHSYWTTDYLCEMPGFRSVMSRDRWQIIWQFFHACDNDLALPRDHPRFDKLFKVRRFVEIMLEKWQGAYYPGRNVSVDESIIAFKGRVSMMQYNPMKPHKWGMKAWVLSESGTGYIYNWDLYKGAPATGKREEGMTQKVVLDITRPVQGENHHVYMDNFFSSPELFIKLADNNTGACGTLRPNRSGTPGGIKDCQKKMKKGDPPVFVRDGKLLFIAWEDKKTVNLVTSLHNEETLQKTVRCRDAENNYQRQITKPKAIEIYNKNMGG